MEIIHKFNTNDPADVALHNHHHYSERYFCVLAEIKRYVRTMWKWEDMGDEAKQKVDQIYEMICHNTKDLDI